MQNKWIFKDPENVAVFTTKQIINDGEPILFVYHDIDDGAWQFHGRNITSIDDAMIVSLRKIVELDCTINELFDLPVGWMASRGNINESFNRKPNDFYVE